MKSLILLPFLAYLCHAQYTFDSNFKFGVATASYQVEGAWDVGGKGENIWDYMTHNFPEKIDDLQNGDDACDAYHKTAGDVQLLANMNVDFYRISISWSRILPSGHPNNINEEGIAYYDELITALSDAGITPLITMYHWDLPQPLQELGGWTNPLMSDYFENYANILYQRFGDRVTDWLTFNEPYQICEQGYSSGEKAPAYTQQGVGGYSCSYTLLMAHAKAYHLYDNNYRATQQGRVGITISGNWYQPLDETSSADIEAAENRMQFYFGLYANPIFSSTGNYPQVVRDRIDQLSIEQGFSRSRLPTFTDEEVDYILGTADYLGLNLYTSFECTTLDENDDSILIPSFTHDTGALCTQSSDWESGASSWMKITPWGLREHLIWINNQYDNPEVVITENGYSDTDGIQDCRRIYYYNSYLEQLLIAINEDNCQVTGYTAWSFMDNFEWMRGYTERFGLHYVDFTDPERPRTPKMSSYVYANIIETKAIDWTFQPSGFDACVWNNDEDGTDTDTDTDDTNSIRI